MTIILGHKKYDSIAVFIMFPDDMKYLCGW